MDHHYQQQRPFFRGRGVYKPNFFNSHHSNSHYPAKRGGSFFPPRTTTGNFNRNQPWGGGGNNNNASSSPANQTITFTREDFAAAASTTVSLQIDGDEGKTHNLHVNNAKRKFGDFNPNNKKDEVFSDDEIEREKRGLGVKRARLSKSNGDYDNLNKDEVSKTTKYSSSCDESMEENPFDSGESEDESEFIRYGSSTKKEFDVYDDDSNGDKDSYKSVTTKASVNSSTPKPSDPDIGIAFTNEAESSPKLASLNVSIHNTSLLSVSLVTIDPFVIHSPFLVTTTPTLAPMDSCHAQLIIEVKKVLPIDGIRDIREIGGILKVIILKATKDIPSSFLFDKNRTGFWINSVSPNSQKYHIGISYRDKQLVDNDINNDQNDADYDESINLVENDNLQKHTQKDTRVVIKKLDTIVTLDQIIEALH